MRLIVGLGNPGAKYKNTRHNVGFMALDYYAQRAFLKFIDDKKFQAEILKIENSIFIKPQTYMNLSGYSVKLVKEFYKVEQILVIHDDLDLNFGTIKFKFGGNNGGHNGLKSINENATKDYIRIRIGIGHPNKDSTPSLINLIQKNLKQLNVIDYVLEKFNTNELETLDKIFEVIKNAIDSFQKGETLIDLQNKYTHKS